MKGEVIMEILRLCKDLFGETPKGASIREFFQQMRKKYDSNRSFFMTCSQYLGGRSYNEFFDYSLFAIKLNHIHKKWCTSFRRDDGKWSQWVDGSWEEMSKAILNLLADDRHDMWQNVPSELNNVAILLDAELQLFFWTDVVDAMIECINVRGTGDISVGFVIKE